MKLNIQPGDRVVVQLNDGNEIQGFVQSVSSCKQQGSSKEKVMKFHVVDDHGLGLNILIGSDQESIEESY